MTLNANVSHYFDNHDYFEYLKQHCSDDTLVGASGRITGLEQMQDFFERMGFTPQHTTLEVGCGTGRVLKVLHRQYGVVAHGVDPCSEAIAYARKELPEHAGTFIISRMAGFLCFRHSLTTGSCSGGSSSFVSRRTPSSRLPGC